MVTFRNNNNNRRSNFRETIEISNLTEIDKNLVQVSQIMIILRENLQVEITIMPLS